MDWIDYMTYLNGHSLPPRKHDSEFYIPRLTENQRILSLFDIALTKLLYLINIYPIESHWHKHGTVELMYDEDPNPKLFIVNKMYDRYIDMVEIFKANFEGEPEMIFQYSRSFYPEENQFFRGKPIFLDSKKINWEEIGNKLQLSIIKFL